MTGCAICKENSFCHNRSVSSQRDELHGAKQPGTAEGAGQIPAFRVTLKYQYPTSSLPPSCYIFFFIFVDNLKKFKSQWGQAKMATKCPPNA